MTTTASPAAGAVLDALGRLQITTISSAYLEAVAKAARSTGATYRVLIGTGGRWACSCPAATYGGRRSAPCKHTAALRALAGALPSALKGDWA